MTKEEMVNLLKAMPEIEEKCRWGVALALSDDIRDGGYESTAMVILEKGVPCVSSMTVEQLVEGLYDELDEPQDLACLEDWLDNLT